MSWCKSKRKPIDVRPEPSLNLPVNNASNGTNGYFANGVNGSTLSQTNNSPSVLRTSKSKLAYTAQDYDALPLNNQSLLVSTKKVTHFVQDRQDRIETYAQEINRANESKLILPNKVLNYDLDVENGVSKTPIINTFDYFSGLNHLFISQSKNNSNFSNSYGDQINRLNNPESIQHISSKIAEDHNNYNPQVVQASNISGNSYQQPLVANSNISGNQPYPSSNLREPINNYSNNSITGLRNSDIA